MKKYEYSNSHKLQITLQKLGMTLYLFLSEVRFKLDLCGYNLHIEV